MLNRYTYKYQNKYVFGLRKNKPTSGYYFVPGGRILNNEIYEVTIKRILKNELGLSIINPNVNFEDITNLINNIEFEIPLFILLLLDI